MSNFVAQQLSYVEDVVVITTAVHGVLTRLDKNVFAVNKVDQNLRLRAEIFQIPIVISSSPSIR